MKNHSDGDKDIMFDRNQENRNNLTANNICFGWTSFWNSSLFYSQSEWKRSYNGTDSLCLIVMMQFVFRLAMEISNRYENLSRSLLFTIFLFERDQLTAVCLFVCIQNIKHWTNIAISPSRYTIRSGIGVNRLDASVKIKKFEY